MIFKLLLSVIYIYTTYFYINCFFRTGVKRIIGGHIDLVGKNGEGKLNVKYTTTPISTETTLTVLDTDYDSYAVVWSCSGFGPIHARKSLRSKSYAF